MAKLKNTRITKEVIALYERLPSDAVAAYEVIGLSNALHNALGLKPWHDRVETVVGDPPEWMAGRDEIARWQQVAAIRQALDETLAAREQVS